MRNTISILVRILGNAAISLIGLALLLAAAPVASAQTVDAVAYVGEHQSLCGTLDLSSGVFTETGSLPYHNQLNGIAGLGGNLYGAPFNELEVLNIQNCTLTTVGPSNFNYLAFGGTTSALYAIGTDLNVYLINPANGSSERLGSTGLSSCSSASVVSDEAAVVIQYHGYDNQYFLFTCDNGGGSILYQISIVYPRGFQVGTIGPTGVSSIEAMVFVGNTLYATNAAGEEYTINTSTGAATLVTSTTQPITAMGVPASAFSVLHTFTGENDGGLPFAGMIMDPAGNLYGTAAAGGTGSCSYLSTTGCGTIFELKNHNGSWLFNPLYSFQGGTDGEFPVRPLTIGPNGTFYGTTVAGGEGTCTFNGASGCGVVFNTGPSPTVQRTPLLKFLENPLYRFTGGSDGANPYSTVIFDQAGNMYGTTVNGGIVNESCPPGCGTVFELSPAGGGTYTERVIYSFAGSNGHDGANPNDGLIFDTAGNLYGTTEYGANPACANNGGNLGCGTVFKLSPAGGGTWTETVIYKFTGLLDGQNPQAGVAMDRVGNLYGTSVEGGGYGGNVYGLSPNGSNWNFSVIFNQQLNELGDGRVVLGPDSLYETSRNGGAFGYGQIVELTFSNGYWFYTDLYDFTNASDGAFPYSGVVLDSSGNLYGTSESGAGTGCGGSGCGVVWELTPTASY